MSELRCHCPEEALNKRPIIRLVGRPNVESAPEDLASHIKAILGQVGPCVIKSNLPPARMCGLRKRDGRKAATRNRFEIRNRYSGRLGRAQRLLERPDHIVATVLAS